MAEDVLTEGNATLDSYYHEEVWRRICEIESALGSIDSNGHFDENIKSILSSCVHIMDLGMIHGYEGVEAIAEQMFAAARYCAWQGSGSLDDVRRKLNGALVTLKQVVNIADQFSARELIDQARHSMDYQIDDLNPINADAEESEDVWSEPIRSKKTAAAGVDESQDRRTSGDANGTPPVSKNGHSTDCPAADMPAFFPEAPAPSPAAENDQIETFEQGGFHQEIEAIDQELSGRLTIKLDEIEESVRLLLEDVDPEVSIGEITARTTELSKIGNAFANTPVGELIQVMHEVAASWLSAPPLRQTAIEVLIDCLFSLRAYMKNGTIENSELLTLKDKVAQLEALSQAPPPQNGAYDELFHELDSEEGEIPAPPRAPLVVRLKRVFGMV